MEIINKIINFFKSSEEENISESDKLKIIQVSSGDFFPPLTIQEVSEHNSGKIDIFESLDHIYINTGSYYERMNNSLLFYFMNLDKLKGKYNEFFYSYLKWFFKSYNKSFTKTEVNKLLNGEKSISELIDYWKELSSAKNNEEYEKIMYDRLQY